MKCLMGFVTILLLISSCKKDNDKKSDRLVFVTTARANTEYYADHLAYKYRDGWSYLSGTSGSLLGNQGGSDSLIVDFPGVNWKDVPQYKFGIRLVSKWNESTDEYDIDLDADDWIQTEFYINGVLHDTQKGQSVEFSYPN